MARNKTSETQVSVSGFIDKIKDERKRDDSWQIISLMQKETGFEPKMWGPSIIGFGSYHYVYASGHEGDMPIVAFSPRSTAIVLYLSLEESDRKKWLPDLGKHKTGKGCIYVKKLEDVSLPVLKKLTAVSVKNRKKNPSKK